MEEKTVLVAACNHYTSPYQVGSQQIARTFRKLGWKVIYISEPVSLLHLLSMSSERKLIIERFKIALSKGKLSSEGISYGLPFAFLSPKNFPFLRNKIVFRNWYKILFSNYIKRVKEKTDNYVDVLYIDSVIQGFWMNEIGYDKLVFRVADNNRAYGHDYSAYREQEEEIAKKADLTLYTSENLSDYTTLINAENPFYFPNGVEYNLFERDNNPEPDDLRKIPHPRVVYIGDTQLRFDKELIKYAAEKLQKFSFVIIGNKKGLHNYFGSLPNIHLLGYKNYFSLSVYLQNCDVGIICFKTGENTELIKYANPIKLYQYFAAGLPVISSNWEGIRKLNPPAYFYNNKEEFVNLLKQTISKKKNSKEFKNYAASVAWENKISNLIKELGF